MVEFKIVINDNKTGKSYQKILQDESLLGKKIRDKVDGKLLGLQGYELVITGGSDSAGIPMRQDVDGIARRRIMIESGTGLRSGTKGTRYRKSVKGNTIGSRITQLNMNIIKYGQHSVEEALGIKKEEAKKEAEKSSS